MALELAAFGCDCAADLISRVQVARAVVKAGMATKVTVVLQDDLDRGPGS
jgi:hypothetical protein